MRETRTLQDLLHWSARFRRIWDNLATSRYERHLLEQIEQLRDERAMWKQKCERLELAVMPLASVAGARYAQAVNPPKPPEIMEPSANSWAAIQANWARDLEKEEKSHGNGVSTKEV